MATLWSRWCGLFSIFIPLIMLLGSCSSNDASQANPCDTPQLNKRIYLIASDSMKMVPKENPNEYTVVLEGLQKATKWYLDKPLTGYGEQEVQYFCDDIWPCLTNVADPNAVAVVYTALQGSDDVMPSSIVLKLENLVYDTSGSIQLDAYVLGTTTELSETETLSFNDALLSISNNAKELQDVGKDFVQTAGNAVLKYDQEKGVQTLTLNSPNLSSIWFNNAPLRFAGEESTSSFLSKWDDRFGDAPPNAHLSGRIPEETDTMELVEFTILKPVQSDLPDKIEYTVTIQSEDISLPFQLNLAALFIDDASSKYEAGTNEQWMVNPDKQKTGASDASGYGCEYKSCYGKGAISQCKGTYPRFNWVLGLSDEEAQAAWESLGFDKHSELGRTELKLNYIMAMQYNKELGQWVLDKTSSVIPPKDKTIGFSSGCDNKGSDCKSQNKTQGPATAMAQTAYNNWTAFQQFYPKSKSNPGEDDYWWCGNDPDPAVFKKDKDGKSTGTIDQCKPDKTGKSFWENNTHMFGYTNLTAVVNKYPVGLVGAKTFLANPQVYCEPLKEYGKCKCNKEGTAIVDNNGNPCANWAELDKVDYPLFNDSGRTPHYLVPVYYDSTGTKMETDDKSTPVVAKELSNLFIGAGDWQTKFGVTVINSISGHGKTAGATNGLGPPAMMFVVSVVGPGRNFTFYPMTQTILNLGPSSEGRCWFWDKYETDAKTPKCKLFHCWGGRGNAEYDLLEPPFWGFGEIDTPSGEDFIRYENGLPMDRLYVTTGNAAGYCSPWPDGGTGGRGGAGTSSFFHTKGMTPPNTAGDLSQHTWIYAFVFDISGLHAYRWRADDTVNRWPGMPMDSRQLLAGLDESKIPYWDGTKLHEAATVVISKTPEPLGNWTPAWSQEDPEKAVLIYLPSCVKKIDGEDNKFYDPFCWGHTDANTKGGCPDLCSSCANWWEAYEKQMPFEPDKLLSFVPGCDATVNDVNSQGCYTFTVQDRWDCPELLGSRSPKGCGWRVSEQCEDWGAAGCDVDHTNIKCRQCSTKDGKCNSSTKFPDGYSQCGDGKDPDYCEDATTKEKCGKACDDPKLKDGYGVVYDPYCCPKTGFKSGCNAWEPQKLPLPCRQCSKEGNKGGFAECGNLTPNCATEEAKDACGFNLCCEAQPEGCSLEYDEDCKTGKVSAGCIGKTGCRYCAVTKGSCAGHPEYAVCK